jgi:hypothetical protein
MMSPENLLTSTDILAAASEALVLGGYRRIADSVSGKIAGSARIFEDPYSVVQLVVYETWTDLETNWTDAQGVLVELISKYVVSTEPKAWDGYLVLLTPSILPTAAREQAIQIKNNFNRVRKFLATGDELKTTSDVERLLLPLLPLAGEVPRGDQSSRVLDFLPEILSKRGIDRAAVETLVTAFAAHQPLLENLHRYLSKL